jgi:hypothetical protein
MAVLASITATRGFGQTVAAPSTIDAQFEAALQPPALAPQKEKPCPTLRDLKPIADIRLDIRPQRSRFEDVDLPPECPLEGEPFLPRMWADTTYTWTASGLCHRPLYFEEPALERYGHTWGHAVQPFVSGAHFFATIPVLPYKMGLEPPCECIYPLGYYTPGNCAPRMIPPVPFNLQAALLEAGTVTGLIFLVP